jgi:membrane-bound serine protease (ClpP class)
MNHQSKHFGMFRSTTAAAILLVWQTWSPAVGQESQPPDQSPVTELTERIVPPSSDEGLPSPEAEVHAPGTGVMIPITDEISDVTTESIKRRVEDAKKTGVTTIIFEINTPGGYVTSALDICNFIKRQTDIKTVAWVNTDAYSAGSMIALACDEIVMSRASVIGDCGVILGTPTGAEAVPEDLKAKAESPVLEQFRDSARMNDYDRLLCESFVRSDMEVWWIENESTGEREFVTTEVKEQRVTDDETRKGLLGSISKLTQREGGWKLVETYHDINSGKEVEVDQPVVKSTELLTMSEDRAYAFGFSKGIVNDKTGLKERYNLAGELTQLDFSWSEVFARWLTSMPVRGFLLIIVFLGAYVEFNTPGVGVAGLVSLIALGIFLGAPFVTGLANFWEIVVVILGFILLAVEVFVIPGFGVAGITGIVLLMVGLLATFMPDEPGRFFPIYWPSLDSTIDGLEKGLQTVGLALVISIAGMFGLARYLPKTRVLAGLIPENPTMDSVAVEDPYQGVARVSDIGVAQTPLRPSGKARFGAILVDVVAEGGIVDPGTEIEVILREGKRVVVRPIRNT